ncbi:hypothetical protein B4U79_14960 [Dinothrombium tinctorium]|uniref:Uncharacterized protein n=1 Tax=Dinothrombium tinctorium TaxID=1965070 RepID=A0A443QWI2_9ACAR|nr:hypothetical protein B4U79_14960 [Dinothrombium tinctorium]
MHSLFNATKDNFYKVHTLEFHLFQTCISSSFSAICRSHECAQFLCELNSVYFDLDACLAEIASSFEPRACILPGNVTANGDYAKPYLSNEYVLNCTKEAQLTQLDQETGALNFTKEGDKENVLCFYSWIKRGEDDSSLVYSKPRRLYRSGLKFTADNYVANITCYEYDRYPFVNIGRVYHETHVWIPNFEHKTAKVGTNVLIVVIESLSHLNFLRLMPKTQAALKNLGHFQFMNGLTKVGDNSFPNSMAMIAGEISDMDYKYKGYWDKRLDYVWNKFNAKGYVTGFMEDFVPIGLFDYRRYGFAHSPTDFFPRPFWYHSFGEEWDLYKSMQNFTWFCFDKKGAKVEVFFNVLMAFIEKMNRHKKPYFMYSFYSQVTHENFNSVKMIDEYTADFLSKVSKYLENTVLIFMGDHGPRFGGYVDTPLGRLEERMPLLAIRIPESLNIEYPHLRKILNLNKDRLMTWFDIHAFLDDIAQEEYHFHPPTNLSSINPTRAIIPANRTCKSALVSEMYCVCNDIVGVEPYYSSHVWRACKKLINQFNVWLPNNCKPLKEKDLLSAEVSIFSISYLHYNIKSLTLPFFVQVSAAREK